MSARYFGENLTIDDCEILSLAMISARYRAREAMLYGVKWFDYRHLHPVKATFLFAHCYSEAVREGYGKIKDINSKDEIVPLTPVDIFSGRDLVALWLSRQMQDAIGCPYTFGCRWIMNRFIDRGWRIFPRPNQIYSEELVCDLRDSWRAECAISVPVAKASRFGVESYVAHPDQISYIEFMHKVAAARARPPGALARYIGERQLHEDQALIRFGEEALNEAKRISALCS